MQTLFRTISLPSLRVGALGASLFTPLSSAFSTTAVLQYLPKHRLFLSIDWDRVGNDEYAVVDPLVPSRILYLSEQDYIIMVRQSWTNNRSLKVLASPGDSPDSAPTSSSSSLKKSPYYNSPTGFVVSGIAPGSRLFSRLSYLFHSSFKDWVRQDEENGNTMIVLTDRNVRSVINRWHNLVSWWSRGRLLSTLAATERNSFSFKIAFLYRCNGINYLIQYMKGCLYAVNAFLSGRKLSSDDIPGDVRISLRHGLPAILPNHVRIGIRQRNNHFIHTWCSVLNAYKAFQGVYGPVSDSLKTIVQPHPLLDEKPEFIFLVTFARVVFWKMINKFPGLYVSKPDLKVKNLFVTSKAGPACPNAVLGAPRDAAVWLDIDSHYLNPDNVTDQALLLDPQYQSEDKVSRNCIREWLLEIGDTKTLELFVTSGLTFKAVQSQVSELFNSFSIMHGGYPELWNTHKVAAVKVFNFFGRFLGGRTRDYPCKTYTDHKPILSRLHALFEPAGKIRIVAIVDYWTNCVLKPLHDWMFAILQKIPTDATFDQEGALKRFAELGYTHVWSLDLSSATDLIPIRLYQALFTPILGERIVSIWLRILVERPFLKPKQCWVDPEGDPCKEDWVQYGTGQPMGALSSWSSMALAHHLLVQASAFLASNSLSVEEGLKRLSISDPSNTDAYKTAVSDLLEIPVLTFCWFLAYLVLGDDVVIADEKTALAYQNICASLGIKINLKKSHISEIGFFNFANQSYVKDTNVSPVSLKEFAGVNSLAQRAEMALRIVRRGWIDASGPNWLCQVVRLFLGSSDLSTVKLDRAKGKNHPVINWICSVLLVPRADKGSGLASTTVGLGHFLASQLRKCSIWSLPLQQIDKLVTDADVSNGLFSHLMTLYEELGRQYTIVWESLEGYETWKELHVSPCSSPILDRIVHEQTYARLLKWDSKYQRKIEEVWSTLLAGIHTPGEHDPDTPLFGRAFMERAALLISAASKELPHLPDFNSMEFDVILGDLDVTFKSGTHRKELDKYVRTFTSVFTEEHLYSHASPGLQLNSPIIVPTNVSKRKNN